MYAIINYKKVKKGWFQLKKLIVLYRRDSMHIAIIDDVAEDREIVRKHGAGYMEAHAITAQFIEYSSGEEFLKEFNKQSFDIVFLDIFMKGENGMEIAKQMRKRDAACILIFTTSSPDFAIEGYQVKASNYVLKPITYEKMEKTLSALVLEQKEAKSYIEIKEGRVMVKVSLRNILFTDYYNHYIQIHTVKHVYRTYLSFAEFEKMLEGYPQFISCYRNIMVNLDYVDSMDSKDFILKDGCHIPIAKPRRQEIRQLFADYLFKKIDGEQNG